MGRRVFRAIHLGLVGWLAGCALVSVVTQVFVPPPAHGAALALPEGGCDEALRRLEAELLTRASDELAALGDRDDARAALGAFFADWDARHAALGDACGARSAYEHLPRLRHALDLELGRTLDLSPLARELDAALDADLAHAP